MFKSKRRPIVFPQSEHLKLAGTLAWLWGNAAFEPPAVEHASFVAGVALHDRGYGYLDNAPIDGMPESDWMQITRRGFYMPWPDPVADLIARFHLRRLVSYGSSPERLALLAELDGVIDQQLQRHSRARDMFERIDRLANFCDSIAFDFCFEQPGQGTISVFPKNSRAETTPLRYAVDGEAITVDPWPFSVETFSNYLVGYALEGYPTALAPVIAPFRVSPAIQKVVGAAR